MLSLEKIIAKYARIGNEDKAAIFRVLYEEAKAELEILFRREKRHVANGIS